MRANVKVFLNGIASDMDREALKDLLSTLIDQIILDPVSHDSEICYRISADLRNKMASPRERSRWPVFVAYENHTKCISKSFGL